MKKIELVKDTISNEEIDELISWLKTYPRLTKGSVTKEFEKKWSEWIGCKYSVFVNSGSSPNLLIIYTLKFLKKLKNKKVCVPLSWATDLSPILQLDLHPILVDCNLENLSVDLFHLEKIFKEENPSCLILVSVLGFSPNMSEIVSLCQKYNVILLEDNCESQGTKYDGIKLGNFGLMSSFSTYFGHTMSTIEGGFVCTNDEEIYHTILQLRSHGWDRDLPEEKQIELQTKWNVDKFNSLYTFYIPGFNFRSTDLQAKIGLSQLNKVDNMIEIRHKNFLFYEKLLFNKIWFPKIVKNSYTANFPIPIIFDRIESKFEVIEKFKNLVECRPLISGSMGTQPFYKQIFGELKLPNVNLVDSCGMYVPNHPNLTENDIKYICEIILSSK